MVAVYAYMMVGENEVEREEGRGCKNTRMLILCYPGVLCTKLK